MKKLVYLSIFILVYFNIFAAKYPTWVKNPNQQGYIGTTGYAKKGEAGLGFAKDAASSDAREKMVLLIKECSIDILRKIYAKFNIKKEICIKKPVNLENFKIKGFFNDKKDVYVWLVSDIKDFRKTVKETVIENLDYDKNAELDKFLDEQLLKIDFKKQGDKR